MEPHERQLLSALQANADAFDEYFDDTADAPVISKRMGSAPSQLSKSKGNPAFSASFDLTFQIIYFTLNSGAYTNIAASALSATLKTQLPVFLFGWNDFKAGYAKLRQNFPVNVWAYGRPGIFGKDSFSEFGFDATVNGKLLAGDMVIPFTSALPGAGTTSLALVVIRSTQVAYGTLLESLVSDKFVMNMIRYTLPDETAASLAQYSNNVNLFKMSLFGKFDSDFVSPNSFKKPEQQQKNLIDIPLKRGIDKEKSMGFYLNYDVPGVVTWSTFVWTVHKL
jgi:hypothetical protein